MSYHSYEESQTVIEESRTVVNRGWGRGKQRGISQKITKFQ